MPAQGLDGLALPAVAGAGQALGMTHGSGWALEEPTSTLQPGWMGTESPVSDQLWGGSLLIKRMQELL